MTDATSLRRRPLLLNRYLGWWWADGVLALAALWLFREGRQALTEGKLCAC